MSESFSAFCRTFPSAVLVFGVLLAGCASAQRQPLDKATIDRGLAAPDPEALRIAAAQIRHPLLAPVVLDSTRGLDAASAGVVAVLVNPTLRAARDQRALAAAQILQAGLLPNPQLSAGFDHPLGGQPGLSTAWSLGLTWDVSALVTRGARQEAARDQAVAVDLDIAWQEWQVAAAARLAVWRVLADREQLALAADIDHAAQEQAELMAKAVAAGARLASDGTAAQSSAADAHQALLQLRQDKDQQDLALARAIGVADVPIIANAPLPDVPLPDAAALGADLADRRLDLIALRRGYDSQEATVRAAVLGRFPHISLGLNRARDTSRVQTVGPALAIDLPVFDRNQAAIASETATRARLRDEFIARIFEARADLAAGETMLADLDVQRAAAADAITIAAAGDERQHRALMIGATDAPSAGAAHLAWLQRRLERARLDQARIETVAALELAAGRPLDPPPALMPGRDDSATAATENHPPAISITMDPRP